MKWNIQIENFLGGFAPNWYKESYPSIGNANHAGDMQNIDLTNSSFLQQGPALSTFTNGNDAGGVTTLIKGISRFPIHATDRFYGVGGEKIYRFSSTTSISDSYFPHTITKAGATNIRAWDVAHYRGSMYATYDHDAVGEISQFTVGTTPTFDDDWGSTVPSGAATLDGTGSFDTPRQLCKGGNATLYAASRRYITSYDGSTYVPQALDLPYSFVVQSIQWAQDRLWIAANDSELNQGIRSQKGSIFLWDGTTDSWEKEIAVGGKVGGIYAKEDVVYVFFQDNGDDETYYCGYVDGEQVVKLAQFTGALPAFYQISEWKNFLIWVSDDRIYAYGAGHPDLPVRTFQVADAGYATPGGLANPLGTPCIASQDDSSTNKIASFSGYDTTSSWKSLLFDITGQDRASKLETVRINFELLTSGARVDWSLVNNKGATVYSDIISYTKLGAVTTAWYNFPGTNAENFRIVFNFANGSASAPVQIKSVQFYGSN